jgi:hypothetical protein
MSTDNTTNPAAAAAEIEDLSAPRAADEGAQVKGGALLYSSSFVSIDPVLVHPEPKRLLRY